MRLALAATLMLSATPILADAVTYEGTLGGREVQVELAQPGDGEVVGRFAYADDGADVPLRPVSVEGNVWTLAEEAPCTEETCTADDNGTVANPPIAATWILAVDEAAQTLSGTRAPAGKSKSQAIELVFVSSRPIDGEVSTFALHDRSTAMSFDPSMVLDWDNAPYEMNLLDVDYEQGALEVSGGLEWRYVSDPRSGLTFPRIVTMEGAAVTLGQAMDTHFYRMILSAFDCKAFLYGSYGVSEYFIGQGGHTAGYEEEQITLTHLSPQAASWTQSGSLYCTGAHPYNHLDSYTLDAATGQPVDWRSVFSAWVPRPWFSPPEDVASVAEAEANPDGYRWGPAADLIAFVREQTPQDLWEGDGELAELCFSDQSIADQLTPRFEGEDRIAFSLSGFPHVSSVCNGELFSAPVTDLKPFLAESAARFFPSLDQ